jgi:hypothetical protein
MVFFATPNGTDSSAGYAAKLKQQINELRQNSTKYQDKNLVLVVAAPRAGKWAAFNKANPNRCLAILTQAEERLKTRLQLSDLEISVDSHSGGGYFQANIINSYQEIPAQIRTLDFFDSLYWYDGPVQANKIYSWLQSNPANRLNLVSGTPQVFEHQEKLLKDLQALGVQFNQHAGTSVYREATGMNGQINVRALNQFSHGGTLSWMGLASTKDPQSFDMRTD